MKWIKRMIELLKQSVENERVEEEFDGKDLISKLKGAVGNRTVRMGLYAVIIGQVAQQFVGTNTVMYYSPIIGQFAGFSSKSTTMTLSLVTYSLNAIVKSLEKQRDEALIEVKEKDDLIKTQVDEFVETSHRLICEKNELLKKLNEVEKLFLNNMEIVSIMKAREQQYIEEHKIAKLVIKDLINGSIDMKKVIDLAIPQGESSILKDEEKFVITSPPLRKTNIKKIKKSLQNNSSKAKGNASRDNEINLKLRHASALDVDKHDIVSKHANKSWVKKSVNHFKLDKA
ncbi:hypothetical protein Dsin_028834 [Dipteronia sinensis]|uniref:Uncharacterized protein n=1 Tax=Dipteronia sinensis TaxID=43782 RepID=A0AAD9ZRG5_9ROSI|nr:hypothetical protein Dsin_028834 [Dipteronia sinensis]